MQKFLIADGADFAANLRLTIVEIKDSRQEDCRLVRQAHHKLPNVECRLPIEEKKEEVRGEGIEYRIMNIEFRMTK